MRKVIRVGVAVLILSLIAILNYGFLDKELSLLLGRLGLRCILFDYFLLGISLLGFDIAILEEVFAGLKQAPDFLGLPEPQLGVVMGSLALGNLVFELFLLLLI